MDSHIVIMAGGVGSRFWPLSTPECPKQFVDIMGTGKSMIQMTVDRFLPLCPIEHIWVVTGECYVNTVKEHLPQLPNENILAEPVARNTAPCIAYACWKIQKKYPNANIVVTPSDAYIEDVEEFRRVVLSALTFTGKEKNIVTIGIQPTRPETGYGYIETSKRSPDLEDRRKVIGVSSFKEKPDLETAKGYLESGTYLWNAGIFMWNVNTITESLRRFAPALSKIMDKISDALYTEREAAMVNEFFPLCEKISIDYAVMEKADYIYTITGDFGWSDVGTWGSLKALLPQDANGNAIVGKHIHLHDCKNCIVHAPEMNSIVLSGMSDMIIAEHCGKLLFCPLQDEQKITAFEK